MSNPIIFKHEFGDDVENIKFYGFKSLNFKLLIYDIYPWTILLMCRKLSALSTYSIIDWISESSNLIFDCNLSWIVFPS